MRLVKVRGRQIPIPSAAHKVWFDLAMQQAPFIRTQMRASSVATLVFPITAPVSVCATFYRDADRGDLLSYMEALADWMQEPRLKPKRNGAGIIADDKQICSWDGTRMLTSGNPRIEVTISIVLG
jgi:hypothetical protein